MREKCIQEFMDKAKKYIEMPKLTPELLQVFIHRIEVGVREAGKVFPHLREPCHYPLCIPAAGTQQKLSHAPQRRLLKKRYPESVMPFGYILHKLLPYDTNQFLPRGHKYMLLKAAVCGRGIYRSENYRCFNLCKAGRNKAVSCWRL